MADPSLVKKFFPQERNGADAVVGEAQGGMINVGIRHLFHSSGVSEKNVPLEKRQECADSRDTVRQCFLSLYRPFKTNTQRIH